MTENERAIHLCDQANGTLPVAGSDSALALMLSVHLRRVIARLTRLETAAKPVVRSYQNCGDVTEFLIVALATALEEQPMPDPTPSIPAPTPNALWTLWVRDSAAPYREYGRYGSREDAIGHVGETLLLAGWTHSAVLKVGEQP